MCDEVATISQLCTHLESIYEPRCSSRAPLSCSDDTTDLQVSAEASISKYSVKFSSHTKSHRIVTCSSRAGRNSVTSLKGIVKYRLCTKESVWWPDI